MLQEELFMELQLIYSNNEQLIEVYVTGRIVHGAEHDKISDYISFYIYNLAKKQSHYVSSFLFKKCKNGKYCINFNDYTYTELEYEVIQLLINDGIIEQNENIVKISNKLMLKLL